MQKFLKLLFLAVFLGTISSLLSYHAAAARRKDANFGITLVAPNGEYRIDSYFISSREPMILLFKVYDRTGKILLAEYTRDVLPGAWFENWTCTQQRCTEFQYSTGEVDPILLPPTWLDNLLAKFP